MTHAGRSGLKNDKNLVDQTLEQAIDAVVTIDAQNRVTLFNRAAESLWGFDRDEVLGHNVKMLVPLELQESHDALIQLNRDTLVDKIVGTSRQVQITTKAGDLVWVNLALSRIFVGDDIHYTTFVRNVNEERQQQQFIDQTLEQAIDAVVTINASNEIVLFNRAAEKLWEYDRVEVVGQNVKVLVPEAIQPYHDGFVASNRSTRVDKIVGTSREVQIKTKSGKDLWVSLALSRINVGQEIHYTAFVRDVTEEVQRRREYETLSLVANRTTNSVVITDPAGHIEYVNNGFEKLTGYALNECVGKKPGDFLQGPRTDQETVEKIGMHLANQKPFYEEILNYDREGKEYWISLAINPVFDDEGKLAHFISIQANVTSTKVAALEYNYRLDAINRVSAVLELDLDGVVTHSNENFNRLVAVGDSMVGEPLTSLLHSEFMSAQEINQTLENLVGGDFVSGEFRFRDVNGEQRWISGSFNPIFSTSGAITKIVLYGDDASERKRIAQELIEARFKAEASTKAKSDFLAVMSHEIRTPMNGVLGTLGLLKKGELNQQQAHYADLAHSSAESLLLILNDILDFSKIEAGKLELEMLPTRLKSFLNICTEPFSLVAEGKGISLELDIDELADCHLTTDASRLGQVIKNLVGNAIKFTEQGSVKVKAAMVGDNERLQISIEDSGIGIPKEKLPLLFETFTQVDSSMSRRFGGTGLGLAISQELVFLLGGEKIQVASELGAGSQFTFYIPVVDFELVDEADSDLSGVSSRNKNTRSLHVLLVEDNYVNQEIVMNLLEDLGHTAEIANQGAEAIEKIKLSQDTFDVVLMDCQMPVMDGFTATRAIRAGLAGSGNANIPIVAVTANAMKGDQERCRAAGMNDYLSKPVDFDELEQKLDIWAKYTTGYYWY